MIECKGSEKHGLRVRRRRVSISLEASLDALMNYYSRDQGATEKTTQWINGDIERSLAVSGLDREKIHSRFGVLLRARDLHRYVMEEPELTGMKIAVLEFLLFHRTAVERWSAIRPLLGERLNLICKPSLPGTFHAMEHLKRELSDRGSRIGKLLMTVALFNFDRDEESPPENLMIHFLPGRFPGHTWEICGNGNRAVFQGNADAWSPSNPLCRWEFLATDLAHTMFRQFPRDRESSAPSPLQSIRGTRKPDQNTADRNAADRNAADRNAADRNAADRNAADRNAVDQNQETVFCNLEPSPQAEGAAQMDLFPLERAAFLPEIFRLIQRKQGAEGIRLLALLFAYLDRQPADSIVELPLLDICAAAAFNDSTSRGMKSRLRRLEQIVAQLGGIELTRVEDNPPRSLASITRLVTVLGRSGEWKGPQAASRAGAVSLRSADESQSQRLRLWIDSIFYHPGEGSLGSSFRDMPEFLLSLSPKDHPFGIPLYVYLRSFWACEANRAVSIERSADQLIREAGLWVSGTGRYRALEALKRDLNVMKEQGCLGSWRLKRSPIRDAMEDRYRLIPPRGENTAKGNQEVRDRKESFSGG